MNEAEAKKLVDGLDWIAVWRRLDHAEKVAAGIADHPASHLCREEATKILEIVARVRRAYKRGCAVPAGEMEQLRLLSDTANTKITGPLIERGAKVAAGAREGHEAVHGTAEEKAARWRAMADDYRKALAAGYNKTGARSLVAEKHGVSAKTVQRAVDKS
jgi:hypothetical protein